MFDPFLLFDDFRATRPAEYIKGFPWHPHRGIETITYVIGGTVEHGDSMGNRGIIGTGDVQWMTAGSGIIHQEMPKGDAGRKNAGLSALGESARRPQDDGPAISRRDGRGDSGGDAGRRRPGPRRRGQGRRDRRARSRHRDRSGLSGRDRAAVVGAFPSHAAGSYRLRLCDRGQGIFLQGEEPVHLRDAGRELLRHAARAVRGRRHARPLREGRPRSWSRRRTSPSDSCSWPAGPSASRWRGTAPS